MLDAIVIAGIVVFAGCMLALYLGRKSFTIHGKIIVVVSMMASLAIAIIQAERLRTKDEDVWHPNAVRWEKSQIPLAVHWDSIPFNVYDNSFRDAMATWNERVGCNIFKRVPERADAVVTIRSFDHTNCGIEAIAEGPDVPASAWYCDGRYVDIQMKRIDEVRLAYRIALHELGHAIGLAHDEVGAMSRKVVSPRDGDYPEHLLPSDKDVASIKMRYCQ